MQTVGKIWMLGNHFMIVNHVFLSRSSSGNGRNFASIAAMSMRVFCVYFHDVAMKTTMFETTCGQREHTALQRGTESCWRLCSGRLTAVQGFVNWKEWSRPDDVLHWTFRLLILTQFDSYCEPVHSCAFSEATLWLSSLTGHSSICIWASVCCIKHTVCNNCTQCAYHLGYTLQLQTANLVYEKKKIKHIFQHFVTISKKFAFTLLRILGAYLT